MVNWETLRSEYKSLRSVIVWQREYHSDDYIGQRSQGKVRGIWNTYRLDGVDGDDPLDGGSIRGRGHLVFGKAQNQRVTTAWRRLAATWDRSQMKVARTADGRRWQSHRSIHRSLSRVQSVKAHIHQEIARHRRQVAPASSVAAVDCRKLVATNPMSATDESMVSHRWLFGNKNDHLGRRLQGEWRASITGRHRCQGLVLAESPVSKTKFKDSKLRCHLFGWNPKPNIEYFKITPKEWYKSILMASIYSQFTIVSLDKM